MPRLFKENLESKHLWFHFLIYPKGNKLWSHFFKLIIKHDSNRIGNSMKEAWKGLINF